jgi:hypothetical protein
LRIVEVIVALFRSVKVFLRSVCAGSRSYIDHPIVNLAGFYLCWILCVLGGDQWLLFPLGLLTLHFVLSSNKPREISYAMFVCLLGVMVDGGLSLAGVFVFEGGAIIPLWLCVLWLAFSTTFNRSLLFLKARMLLAFCLGGLGGASSYLSGYLLGVVRFNYSLTQTMLIVFCIWTFLVPVLLRVREHFDEPSL